MVTMVFSGKCYPDMSRHLRFILFVPSFNNVFNVKRAHSDGAVCLYIPKW
jgi:hypothetical protein